MSDVVVVTLVEVGGTEIGVVGLAGEEVVGDHEHRVANGHGGLLSAFSGDQAPILCAEVRVSSPAAGMGGLDQSTPQPPGGCPKVRGISGDPRLIIMHSSG